MSGWIKIHRKILEWEWYSDANCFRLFMHLILKANHKDKSYRGMILKAGSIMTGRDILSLETGLSVRSVRTALDKLKMTNEVTIKTSSKGTVIQIVNYERYQVATSETTTETANERPTNDQRTTTNKNVKNIKNKEDNIKALPFKFFSALVDYGFKEDLVSDWIKVRKNKKAANTQTAYNSFIKEIEKRNCKLNDVLELIVSQSWVGFKWEWYDNLMKTNNKTHKYEQLTTFTTAARFIDPKI